MSLKKDALAYHQRGRFGKVEVVPTKPLVSQRDLSLAYSPGVAEPCLAIAEDEAEVWKYTARGNLVAVISNGTAVLGLGDIGPLASKPVMEGKACLFKKFADIDVFDIEIAETDADKLVDIIAALEPTFGGINLEDIAAPACFEVETKLRERLNIPVFHDDQHGTAIISGAALLNACELAGKQLADIKLVVSGAGAAAIACIRFFIELGVTKENVVLCDSRGVVYEGRGNLNPHKEAFACPDDGCRTLADAMKGSDVFLGLSVANLVDQDMVRSMNERPIVFALANPDPEIPYADAIASRDDVLVATGRSDYPNQVNNVLGFPYVFRGALDVRATTITEEMKAGAARSLAALAHESVPDSVVSAYGGRQFEFGPDYLIPKPFDPRVLWWVAPAVAKAAMDSGVARVEVNIDDYRERLGRRSQNAAYSIMRGIVRSAKRDPKRIVFPESNNPKLLRALQIVVDDNVARPVLLGRRDRIERACEEAHVDSLLSKVEIIDPTESPKFDEYTRRFHQLRQRKGVTPGQARHHMAKSGYFGMMMVEGGDADGLLGGLKTTFPATLKPALQIVGLRPGAKVACGMYMMVLKNAVKFFADATINIDPDAETLADIAIQVSDAVKVFGIQPRVAMVSFSNFGSVRHPTVTRVQRALELVRQARPELEIDGEMQADMALDSDKLHAQYPFSRLTKAANVLVFDRLGAANAAYKVLSTLGRAHAVGPLLLGINKPVSLLQNEATVEDIVNMTAYTVMVAQHRQRSQS